MKRQKKLHSHSNACIFHEYFNSCDGHCHSACLWERMARYLKNQNRIASFCQWRSFLSTAFLAFMTESQQRTDWKGWTNKPSIHTICVIIHTRMNEVEMRKVCKNWPLTEISDCQCIYSIVQPTLGCSQFSWWIRVGVGAELCHTARSPVEYNWQLAAPNKPTPNENGPLFLKIKWEWLIPASSNNWPMSCLWSPLLRGMAFMEPMTHGHLFQQTVDIWTKPTVLEE